MATMGTRIRVVSAEIVRDGRYLITQRSAHAVLPLLWEFPGGRVREGETDAQALQRCLAARLGCDVTVSELVLEVDHAYDQYNLVLAVYRCEVVQGEPQAISVADLAWVGPDTFADYEFPGADQRTVEALLADDQH